MFIEFMSAWFLKQYKYFVDTATYFVKIQSIFDRFILVYLAIKDFNPDLENTQGQQTQLIEILQKDINWPESYLTKNEEINLMKEMAITITSNLKELLDSVKNKESQK